MRGVSSLPYRLVFLKIPVRDVGSAAAFYREALGFEEAFVAEEYGWAQLAAGDLPLALYEPGKGGGNGAIGGSTGFHLELPVAEFDRLAQDLLARGALEEDRIHQGADGTTFVEVRDPDGNLLKVHRAAVG